MGVAWTSEQQKVIDLRNRNILVSAAAGSGKTAVLVERIISMITDNKAPIDIDKLLIVTFTNAAAGQMRERISEAIEQRLEEEPENEHLQKQAALVHNAYITTIHSFCLRVIRNNFNRIDLDPSFRIGDDGELKLLKSDVIEKILEKHYEEKSEEFFHFVESYSTGKSDKELEDIILQFYNFAMSYPWPKDWLEDCKKVYQLSSIAEIEETAWYQNITENINIILNDMIVQLNQMIELCSSADGPYMYGNTITQERDMFITILKSNSYVDYFNAFMGLSFGRLSSKKDENVSSTMREVIKKQRDGIKKAVTSLKERYFYDSPEHIVEDIQKCGVSIDVLVDLTNEFSEEYASAKMDKNLVDYSDLEHFALNILVEKDLTGWKPTEVAEEFRDIFEEIMIDEYQDSNLVQEMLLRSVSKERIGVYNSFMVGDVKQSIYKFRLARPELFMDKYNTYSLEEGVHQRIDLDKNFRSRIEVLDGTNFIFHQIMDNTLGGIHYNSECALYLGSEFPEAENERDFETEILLVDLDSAQIEDEDAKRRPILEDKEYTARELEAKAIAVRMKELVHSETGLKIIDKKTKEYRVAKYSDIVILLRTMSGWAETFTSILMAEGIPAHTGSQTGYFSTVEVTILLNLLRIIDNPLQDIPFASVLSSPIGTVSGQEFAMIKSDNKSKSLYEGCRQYALEGCDELLKSKLRKLFEQIEHYRKLAVYTPIHELIWIILDKTHYARFVATMPGGEQRRANLDMLVEKAIAFESTSYKGLFNFIRYIENLQKYNVDFGEAEIVNENDDTVRIISIHKSKGLEFPIVFVSGMAKQFNNQDARAKIIMHPDLGIGADYIDFANRVKAPTLIKRAMQKQIQMENLGEELRVLYVALTRAKEKLILTGAMSKIENKLIGWQQTQTNREKLSFREISEASNYMEWVLQAIMRHKDSEAFLNSYDVVANSYLLPFREHAKYIIKVIKLEDLVNDEIITQITKEETKEELMQGLVHIEDKKTQMNQINDNLNFRYQYEVDKNIHTKMTVSEIKKIGQNTDDENSSMPIMREEIPVPLLPKFLSEEVELIGADRGTAYHKVLQLLDFKSIETKADIQNQIEKMLEEHKITKAAKECIQLTKMERFFHSDLGSRMKKADCEGKLYKERPFVIGVKASEINKSSASQELILVQGIIDAYFEEEKELVIVDYKTDFVKDERELVTKYKIQLDYYTDALIKITDKNIKERIIYSINLDSILNL
ncbi:MAG: helicase-exonuclease AddAB subunit AddA [Lachnotalea sp.]